MENEEYLVRKIRILQQSIVSLRNVGGCSTIDLQHQVNGLKKSLAFVQMVRRLKSGSIKREQQIHTE